MAVKMLHLVEIAEGLNELPKVFPQFNFYLFGSMARDGVGNDVDLMVEVDDKIFREVTRNIYLNRMHPLLKNVVDDPDSYYWTYFSPYEKRLGMALELLDLSKLSSDGLRSMLHRGYGLDIIFLPKNWREEKVLKKLRKYTDQCDPEFFNNLLREARKL